MKVSNDTSSVPENWSKNGYQIWIDAAYIIALSFVFCVSGLCLKMYKTYCRANPNTGISDGGFGYFSTTNSTTESRILEDAPPLYDDVIGNETGTWNIQQLNQDHLPSYEEAVDMNKVLVLNVRNLKAAEETNTEDRQNT